jgi:hypothetical protein
VRRLYGPEVNQELNRLFATIGDAQGMNRIAKQRGLLNTGRLSTAQRHQRHRCSRVRWCSMLPCARHNVRRCQPLDRASEGVFDANRHLES